MVNCENCRYFVVMRVTMKAPDGKKIPRNIDQGDCRIHAPMMFVHGEQLHTAFPQVSADLGCFEGDLPETLF